MLLMKEVAFVSVWLYCLPSKSYSPEAMLPCQSGSTRPPFNRICSLFQSLTGFTPDNGAADWLLPGFVLMAEAWKFTRAETDSQAWHTCLPLAMLQPPLSTTALYFFQWEDSLSLSKGDVCTTKVWFGFTHFIHEARLCQSCSTINLPRESSLLWFLNSPSPGWLTFYI